MKKHILTAVAVILSMMAYAQKTSYYFQDQAVEIQKDCEKLLVVINHPDPINLGAVKGLVFESAIPDQERVLRIYKSTTNFNLTEVGKQVRQANKEAKVYPSYITPEGNRIFPTGKIHVKLKGMTNQKLFSTLSSKFGFKVNRELDEMEGWYELEVLSIDEDLPITVANDLYDTGYFDSSCPEFVSDPLIVTRSDSEPIKYSPSYYQKHGYMLTFDPGSRKQWALYNMDYPQYSINVGKAWNYATGKGIVIAVIALNCDYADIDLKGKLHPKSNPTPDKNIVTPTTDVSGNISAGIAAATRNNNHGIAGVAPDATIMYLGYQPVYKSINDAWKNGADIILINQKVSKEPLIEAAIDSALVRGRSGKGCVVIAPAGDDAKIYNREDIISYPASKAGVLAVSNFDYEGKRNETSSYGENMFISAPGSDVYCNVENNSNSFVTGTMVSSSFVAGVTALMLERNRYIPLDRIKTIIAESANQWDRGYPFYIEREYGLWNMYLGYGAIDALKCVVNTPAGVMFVEL